MLPVDSSQASSPQTPARARHLKSPGWRRSRQTERGRSCAATPELFLNHGHPHRPPIQRRESILLLQLREWIHYAQSIRRSPEPAYATTTKSVRTKLQPRQQSPASSAARTIALWQKRTSASASSKEIDNRSPPP